MADDDSATFEVVVEGFGGERGAPLESTTIAMSTTAAYARLMQEVFKLELLKINAQSARIGSFIVEFQFEPTGSLISPERPTSRFVAALVILTLELTLLSNMVTNNDGTIADEGSLDADEITAHRDAAAELERIDRSLLLSRIEIRRRLIKAFCLPSIRSEAYRLAAGPFVPIFLETRFGSVQLPNDAMQRARTALGGQPKRPIHTRADRYLVVEAVLPSHSTSGSQPRATRGPIQMLVMSEDGGMGYALLQDSEFRAFIESQGERERIRGATLLCTLEAVTEVSRTVITQTRSIVHVEAFAYAGESEFRNTPRRIFEPA